MNIETDAVLVQGTTLRQTIRAAKRQAKDENNKLGTTLYRKWALQFSQSSEANNVLKPKNENDVVRASLKKAVQAANSANTTLRNKGPLTEWFHSEAAPNHRELCGLLKTMLGTNPSSSTTSCTMVLACMKYCSRHSLHTVFPEEIDAAKAHFDAALAASWASMKREGIPLATFWGASREYTNLVVSVSDLDKIMSAIGAWSVVQQEVARVIGSSAVGSKMFGFVVECLAAESMSHFITQSVGTMQRLAKITNQAVHECLERCEAEAANLACEEMLRHKVQVAYRGVQFKLMVESVRDEIDTKIAAMWKTKAIGNGLDELFFEVWKQPPERLDRLQHAHRDTLAFVVFLSHLRPQSCHRLIAIDCLRLHRVALAHLDLCLQEYRQPIPNFLEEAVPGQRG